MRTSEQPGSLPTAPFTLRQVECFIATADAGSISRAASRLHASDSAVADAITAMERAVGTQLLSRRRSRGVTVTSDGLAILPIARRMLVDAEELAAAVGRDPATIVGPVRVGALGVLAPMVLPRLIEAIRARFPGVRVEYRTADQPVLLQAVDMGELDCVVTYDIDVPPELQRRSLATTRAEVVVAADHHLAGADSIRVDQLADEPMVMLDIEASRTHTLELMSARGVTPRIAFRTDNYELCRSLVGRGLGYSLLMSREIEPRTWDGTRVEMIPLDPLPRDVDVLIAWHGTQHALRLRAVIETAVDVCRDLRMLPSPA